MSGKGTSVDVLLDRVLKEKIEINRQKIVPIVDTIKLCGHLGLPFRGQRDDSQHHPDVGKPSKGGIFIEGGAFKKTPK